MPRAISPSLISLARAQCLFAAAAAGVPALDTTYVDFRDTAGLVASCAQARRDGFAGCLAIHPDQIEPINAGFTPSQVELDEARAIVAAFAANPGAGTIGIGGKMYDAPHLESGEAGTGGGRLAGFRDKTRPTFFSSFPRKRGIQSAVQMRRRGAPGRRPSGFPLSRE